MDSSAAWKSPGHWTIVAYFIKNIMQINQTIVLSTNVACLFARGDIADGSSLFCWRVISSGRGLHHVTWSARLQSPQGSCTPGESCASSWVSSGGRSPAPGSLVLCGCLSEYMWLVWELLMSQVQRKAMEGGRPSEGLMCNGLHAVDWTQMKLPGGEAAAAIASLKPLKWVGGPSFCGWHARWIEITAWEKHGEV